MSKLTRLTGLITATIAAAGVLAVASPASAAPADDVSVAAVGKACYGSAVPRCLELRFSTFDPDFIRAHVWIRDADGGTNYDVAVTNVRIQEWSNNWITRDWTINGEYDGWFATEDVGSSGSFDCTVKSRYIRAQAYFRWKNAATGATDGEWRTSYGVDCSGAS
ncbi:MAG: hypothetical protein ACRDT4_09730 [Micromonosporaceae bacterium]